MLPPANANPCSECPWRRNSMKGWLGPFTAIEWIRIINSDEPIACHLTIQENGSWEGASQCRGSAIFRENSCKVPIDDAVATGPKDTKRVFTRGLEFLIHHDPNITEDTPLIDIQKMIYEIP